jgi:hypothetical protein
MAFGGKLAPALHVGRHDTTEPHAIESRDARQTTPDGAEEGRVLRCLVDSLTRTILVLVALQGTVLGADQPASAKFDSDGVKIHYLSQGEGAPVVLIHGMHSSADIN